MTLDSSGDYLPVASDMLNPFCSTAFVQIAYGLGSVFNAYFFLNPHSSAHKFGIYSVKDQSLSSKYPS